MSDIALIIVLSLLFYLIQPVNTQKTLHVPQGSISRIITQLAIYNDAIFPSFDKALMRFFGNPQSGWIDIGKNTLTKADFLYRLCNAKAATNAITLIPGETSFVFLEQLSRDLELSFAELEKQYFELSPLKEGWLVPDTYSVPLGVEEKELISYLINVSTKYHEALSGELFGYFDISEWKEKLIIASIIQKESASIDEMPLVSSVIYNRLKIKMRLQMDGTLNYGAYSHMKVTPERIREDSTAYNTYLNEGLPEFPVCSVSKEAIKAAVNPAKTPYLYFVKGENGKHVFSETYDKHLENIKKIK